MDWITVLYGVNATLLLLHEIESAYEREWEILRLPGGITGFLLMHIPVILLMFYGLLEVHRGSTTGMILGLVFGLSGLLPLLVHRFVVVKPDRFNRPFSMLLFLLNTLTGIGLFAVCLFTLT